MKTARFDSPLDRLVPDPVVAQIPGCVPQMAMVSSPNP